MTRSAGFALAVAALVGSAATPAVAHDEKEQGREAKGSPFVVGVWKFNPNGSVDTEVRFINPTRLTVTLEYAFFDLAGNFCGCDRDTFEPNKTTIYTMGDETTTLSPTNQIVFTCAVPHPDNSGKNTVPANFSGALKSIVFLNHGQKIFVDETSQVGFTTHAFGGLSEENDQNDHSLTGNVMTESAMQPVPVNDETLKEIQKIHDLCVMVNGPL